MKDDDPRDYYERRRRRQKELEPLLDKILFVLFILVALAALNAILEDAWGQDQNVQVFDYLTVWTQTGTERRISWCEDPEDVEGMDLFYKIEVLEFPPKEGQLPVWTWRAPEGVDSIPWSPERAGSYWVRIAACRTDLDQADPPEGAIETPDGWILCSAWNPSTNAQEGGTCINNTPRGFIVRVDLAQATGGGIE